MLGLRKAGRQRRTIDWEGMEDKHDILENQLEHQLQHLTYCIQFRMLSVRNVTVLEHTVIRFDTLNCVLYRCSKREHSREHLVYSI